ncbi:MAG: DUF1934 domain-containing protein [Acholeplasmatales bacterium]|nr:DUF1934 domain-containing protein [Acholeplasmatales bacterium]
MNLTFYSIDSNDEKVIYTTSYKRIDSSTIEFVDKSVEDTVINIKKLSTSSLLFTRTGKVTMILNLELNNSTKGYYKNHLGLEFEFSVYTNKIEFIDNKCVVEYKMNINDIISTHKISILLHKKDLKKG